MRISDWSSDVCSSDLPADRTSQISVARSDGATVVRRPWKDHITAGSGGLRSASDDHGMDLFGARRAQGSSSRGEGRTAGGHVVDHQEGPPHGRASGAERVGAAGECGRASGWESEWKYGQNTVVYGVIKKKK